MAIQSHRDLIVWQLGMDIAERVIKLTFRFPLEERFGAAKQLRDAIWSVPSNIAEGYGRGSRKDYCHFISIAKGSLIEASTQLELAARVGYTPADEAKPLLLEMQQLEKMLSSLRARLRQSPPPQQ